MQCVVIAIFIAAASFWIWDFLDPPMFWQTEAIKNKRAIKHYADYYYPDAKIVSQSYESVKYWGDLSCDSITYEYNDVEFIISARFGKVAGDDYAESKAEKYMKENFLNPFFESHGISSPSYNQTFFGGKPGDNLKEYKGSYSLSVSQTDMPMDFVPKERDWFYDLYLYCIDNCEIESYSGSFSYIMENNHSFILYYNDETRYSTPEEFYADFRFM